MPKLPEATRQSPDTRAGRTRQRDLEAAVRHNADARQTRDPKQVTIECFAFNEWKRPSDWRTHNPRQRNENHATQHEKDCQRDDRGAVGSSQDPYTNLHTRSRKRQALTAPTAIRILNPPPAI